MPASFYFSVDSDTGIIRVRNSLLLDSTTTYSMTVRAVDTPIQGASAREALAEVFVHVRRNPNTPVFDVAAYNMTVSEYLPVRSVVQRMVATDADPANTPSGRLVYSIVDVTFPDPQFNIAPGEAAFFVASPTTGDIILAQQLSQARVPGVFYVTVEAADSAIPPKSARATLTVNIIRNIHRPTFTEIRYGASIQDTWAVGRTLFTVTAVDQDDSEPYNANTNNAFFDYMIDENYPLADTYFGVTLDGVVYVRNNLLLDNSDSYFFYLIAIDRSWQPLSSRAPVTVNVTKTDVVRTIGFTNREQYWELVETTDATAAVTNTYTLEIANAEVGRTYYCQIIEINSQRVFHPVFTTRITNDYRCLVERNERLDRETLGFYNLTVQVGYSGGVGKRSADRVKRQIENVYNTYSYSYIYVSVLDINDNQPAFTYPLYPASVGNRVYVFAVSRSAPPMTMIDRVLATDPDAGNNGELTMQLSQADSNSPFYLDPSGGLYNTIQFNLLADLTTRYVLSVTATDDGDPALSRLTDIHVNLIENKNRFVLVLGNTLPSAVVPFSETIRRTLQNAIGQIVIIESVQRRLVVHNSVLDFDASGTDVVFVVADTRSFLLYENSALDTLISVVELQVLRQNINVGTVMEVRKPFDLTAVTGLSQRLADSEALSELSQFAFSLSKPITKSHVWWTDDPWSALVALAGIIIILAIVAVIIILRSYNR